MNAEKMKRIKAAELYAQHTAATGRRSTCSSAIASPFLAQPIDNPFFCLI